MPQKITLAASVLLFCTAVSGQPRDWADFGRYEKQNAEETADTPPDVVFMGNSITDNWASMDPDFFSLHSFTGRGISGQTSSEMLVRFRRDVIDLRPKAVAILAGINDIAQNNGYISLENTFGNIVSMCELARVHRIKVILCSVLPCDRLSWRPEIKPAEKVKQLNAMLKEYAEDNNLIYVDYWSALANGNGGLDPEISGDGCHPNIQGYRIMEEIFLNAVGKCRLGKR